MPLSPALFTALTTISRTPKLLIASDFDGCISPIVPRPEDAHPNPHSKALLEDCAQLANTSVAIISGRSRTELAERSGFSTAITLVGSHGGEFADGFSSPLDEPKLKLLANVVETLKKIAHNYPQVWVEQKPASAALHVRQALPADATAAITESAQFFSEYPNLFITTGKMVFEVAVISANKGTALTTLQKTSASERAIYFGDDATDEHAFAVMTETDVSIKVGDGTTLAHHRIANPDEEVTALQFLYDARVSYLKTISNS